MTDEPDWFKQKQARWRAGTEKIKAYPGILGQPIFYDPVLGGEQVSDDGSVQKLVTVRQRKYREKTRAVEGAKWDLLFWFYGIEEGSRAKRREELALVLVRQHVPGFRYTNTLPTRRERRGRPRKRSATTDLELLWAVEEARGDLAKKRKCPLESVSVKDAVKRAIKRNPGKWKAKGGVGDKSPESLKTRYFEVKKGASEMLRDPLYRLMNIQYEK